MILLSQYFCDKEHTSEHSENAKDLIMRVNALLDAAAEAGVYKELKDPDTGTQISGCCGGSGDGGFRLPDSLTGSPTSSHKEARGIDVYDPGDKVDKWLTKAILEKFGLYREHPRFTMGWVHLSTRPPKSGCRTYLP